MSSTCISFVRLTNNENRQLQKGENDHKISINSLGHNNLQNLVYFSKFSLFGYKMSILKSFFSIWFGNSSSANKNLVLIVCKIKLH